MGIDWNEVSIRVSSYAARALGADASRADIEELGAEAIARVLESGPGETTSAVVGQALRKVRYLARARRRRRRKARLVLWDDIDVVDDSGDRPTALAARLDRRRLIARIRNEVRDDDVASGLIDAALSGKATRAQLAEAVGVSTAEIDNARRRLVRRARRFVEEGEWNI